MWTRYSGIKEKLSLMLEIEKMFGIYVYILVINILS